MSHHNDHVWLRHMLDHAREAIELAREKTQNDLDENRILQLALVRLVEVVGEAAGRVQKETRAAFPRIPWSQIVAMRNRLIHGYDLVDYDILWSTIEQDLPELVVLLEEALEL